MAAAELIDEFARFLGMDPPIWNGEGAAEFGFVSRGRLVFEAAADDLLMYLIGGPTLPRHHPRLAERALRLCGKIHALPVHAGLTPLGETVLLIRLEPQRQNLTDLGQELDQLFVLQDQLNAEEEHIGPSQTP